VTALFARRLQTLQQADRVAALRGVLRGIEKESLRVTPAGKLAQTPHPTALGSALKHPNITTDFSEALLEFITPACDSVTEALRWLDDIHAFTCPVLQQQQEKLWVASMPCVLESDDKIPLAQYGTTHAARMKTTYREGLGHRYGRLMQTIAGIHYNVSFPDAFWQILQADDGDSGSLQDFKTRRYFDLIRNFRRHLWLLLYLFGASPALCPSFVQGRQHNLQPFDDKTRSLHLPYATSLRMGDLGYQSNAQSALTVCYNSLPSYISTLKKGLTTPYPPYEKIGVRDETGHYRQLSANLLQIENEFYSTIRPKRVTRSGETPILALHERGVEYIEVRCLDLNSFLPGGIDAHTAHFIEAFLLWCLLEDSPPVSEVEYLSQGRNQKNTVERGRDPAMLLEDGDSFRPLPEWAKSIFPAITSCSQLLDQAYGVSAYSESVAVQWARVQDSSLTPSAQVLQDMQSQQKSFFRFASDLSAEHEIYYDQHRLLPARQEIFHKAAEQSLQEQRALEAQKPDISFEDYLRNYYAQYASV
jgi:glutamate--cysteine ligase